MQNPSLIPNGKPADSVKALGIVVRDARRRQGLTQQEAAGLCNVGVRFLSELENGKASLQACKVLQVVHAFGLALVVVPRAGQ